MCRDCGKRSCDGKCKKSTPPSKCLDIDILTVETINSKCGDVINIERIQTNSIQTLDGTLQFPSSITPSGETLNIEGNLNVNGKILNFSYGAISITEGLRQPGNFQFPLSYFSYNSDANNYSLVTATIPTSTCLPSCTNTNTTAFQINTSGTYYVYFNIHIFNINNDTGGIYTATLQVISGTSSVLTTTSEVNIPNGLKGNLSSSALLLVSSPSQFVISGTASSSFNVLSGTVLIHKVA
jgi:hypothetical protein